MTRLLLVLLCLALLALALLGMRWGWRNRLRSQSSLPAVPPVPAALGAPVAGPATGLYVGTTFATSWQDRVVHGGLGLRSDATATLHPEGVLIDRVGAEPVFVPVASITGARLAPGLAGKVVGDGGLLVLRWRLGGAELDTGLRADDRTVYPRWVRAIDALIDETVRSES
jgi:hypothetical protein